MDIEALLERYLGHASGVVGDQADDIEVVLPNRCPQPSGFELALGGWWTPEPAPPGRVVLPNPYDSLEVIAAMEAWVWRVADSLAPRAGEQIDKVLGQPRQSAAYWRIVLAPWLVHLVSAIADRWLFCRVANELVPGRPLAVAAIPEPPATMAVGLARLRTDAGNAGLLAVLAPHLSVTTTAMDEPESPTIVAGSSRRLLHAGEIVPAISRLALAKMLAALPRRRVAIVGLTRLTASDLLWLEARASGLAPLPRPTLWPAAAAPATIDREARERLAMDGAGDLLEELVGQTLPHLVPLSLLEGLDEVRRASRRMYGRPLSALVGNYSVDEVQNEFLARCRTAGKRLAFAQHGGFYLQSPVNAQERLERGPGSVFLSWGGSAPGTLPTPNPYLERLRDSHRGGTHITVIEALEPPDAYVIRFAGHPLANQGYESAKILAEMVERLPAWLHSHLVLKRFPNPTGPPSRPPALEALPSLRSSGGAAAWMVSSRLTIIGYPDTPFVEALVIGTPTIGLWNPSRWPVLEEVEPLFERLRDVGIIHSDPRAAAARVETVYGEIGSWWKDPSVAAAREEFLQRFAVPGDWLEAWSRRLRELRG